MATPYFYRKLRSMAKEHGVLFIVDETKTGLGASGKNWAHEYWYLHEGHEPDFVTFGGAKYSGLSGFYSTVEQRIEGCAQAYSADVNVTSLINHGLTWKTIHNQNLLHWQKDTSSFLKIELDRVQKETGLISDVRGYGTHLAFDCESAQLADLLQRWLLRSGINVLKCGP